MESLTFEQYPFLKELGLSEENLGCYRNGEWVGGETTHLCNNPHDNKKIAAVKFATGAQYEETIEYMMAEQERWQLTPAPVRGEIVREIGNLFRERKDALGSLISLETGKIKSEGDGEV